LVEQYQISLAGLGDRARREINEHGDETMGRQITVDLVPLMKASCKIRIQDNDPEQSWLVVNGHVSQRLNGVLAARQQRPVRKGLTSLAGLGNMARRKINRGRQNVQVPGQAIRPQAV